MKFTVNKDEFQKTLSIAENATTAKSGMHILINVLIKATNNTITIIGTDQELSIKGECEAKVETEGTITLHAKKMMDILKTFPACDIEIESDDKYNITVKSLETGINANFRLQGVSPDEFPEIEKDETNNSFTIPQDLFRDMIRKTIYASSKEESRFFLQGVFFEKREENDKELRLVATDGHRLSIVMNDIESISGLDNFGVMIPQKTLMELLKVLGNEGDCVISFPEKRSFFKVDKMEISSNYLESDFLNYQSVIPESMKYHMLTDAKKLAESIKRISSILDVKEKRIKFEIRKGFLNIFGDNPELGEAVEKLDIEYEGGDIDIGLNYEYVLQTLREVKGKKVLIEVSSSTQPIIVKEEDNNNSLAVIGPMRLSER